MPDPGTNGSRPREPSLEVVVVAYGAADDLRRCLDTLGGELSVVVIDNSSSAEVRAVVESAGVHYLDPGENLGFAAGVNRALRDIDLTGTDVLLLNPDAVVEPAVVRRLQQELRDHPDSACAAPAQRHPVSGAEVRVRWPYATPARAWAEAVALRRRADRWDFVIASVLVIRGRALRQVGGFDEGFFLYAEEADWERRASRLGWRVSFCADAMALHAGAATDTDPERHQLRFHAGVERYVRKWHGAVGWRSYQLASVVTALRRALVRRGPERRRSLRLARLYAGGPYSAARRAGVVPERRHHVPRLA